MGLTDESTVKQWLDLSGNQNNGNSDDQFGTWIGSEPKIDTVKGIKFDGIDDFYWIVDSPSMKLTNYSIIIVLNPEGSLNEQWKGIIGKPGRNNNFWLEDSLYIHHRFKNSSSTNSGADNSPINSLTVNQDNLVQIEHTGSLAEVC